MRSSRVTVVFGLVAALLSPFLGAAALRLSIGAAAVSSLFLLGALRRTPAPARAGLRADRERPRGAAAARRSRASARACATAATAASSRARSTSSRCSRESREWWTPIYADRESVRAAQRELLEIARLLRELPSVRARGVALVTRLVRDGATSPLYQGPAPRLREELGRIRHVLVEA